MFAMIWSRPITDPSCRLYIIKREMRGMSLSEFSSSVTIYRLKPSQRLKPLKPLQPSQRSKPSQHSRPLQPSQRLKPLNP